MKNKENLTTKKSWHLLIWTIAFGGLLLFAAFLQFNLQTTNVADSIVNIKNEFSSIKFTHEIFSIPNVISFLLILVLIKLLINQNYNNKNAGTNIYSSYKVVGLITILSGAGFIFLSLVKFFKNIEFTNNDSLIAVSGFLYITSGMRKDYSICQNGLIIGFNKVRAWDNFESYWWQYEPYGQLGIDEKKILFNLHLKLKPEFCRMRVKNIDLEVPITKKEQLIKLFFLKFNRL